MEEQCQALTKGDSTILLNICLNVSVINVRKRNSMITCKGIPQFHKYRQQLHRNTQNPSVKFRSYQSPIHVLAIQISIQVQMYIVFVYHLQCRPAIQYTIAKCHGEIWGRSGALYHHIN